MTAYRYSAEERAKWIVEILAAADDRPGHRAYALALSAYWGTAEPGDDRGEPTADDIKGVSWKVECALSADFATIHQAKRPEGFYGGEYVREYIKLRGSARRNALLAARERRLKEEAEQAEGLAGLLTLGPAEDREGST